MQLNAASIQQENFSTLVPPENIFSLSDRDIFTPTRRMRIRVFLNVTRFNGETDMGLREIVITGESDTVLQMSQVASAESLGKTFYSISGLLIVSPRAPLRITYDLGTLKNDGSLAIELIEYLEEK
jgi:hypothetical protein